jgi:hypothetical protein
MKLFTTEDRFHVHKLLGLYALGHFFFRYSRFFAGELDMGFARAGGAPRVAALLAPHLALQVSGLRFRVPLRRIVEGSRIWPVTCAVFARLPGG